MELKVDYSIEFYTWCKKLVGTDYKLFSRYDSENIKNVIRDIIATYKKGLSKNTNFEEYYTILEEKVLANKSENHKASTVQKLMEYERIQIHWGTEVSVKIFITALEFILVKDDIFNSIKGMEMAAVATEDLNPLSLTYDNISIKKPYALRVFTIVKINEILDQNDIFTYKEELEALGVELKGAILNILIESVNQSIKSDAGNSYEDKIEDYLRNELGISSIERITHSTTGSIEHDFKFGLEGKKYSISAKRTLRERYKQYVNLVQVIPDLEIEDIEQNASYQKYQVQLRRKILDDIDADILITVTLGTDLTVNKAKTLRAFGVYIFISDEIYSTKEELRKIDGVYSISNLTIDTIKSLQ